MRQKAKQTQSKRKLDIEDVLFRIRQSFWHETNKWQSKKAKRIAVDGMALAIDSGKQRMIDHMEGLLQYSNDSHDHALQLLRRASECVESNGIAHVYDLAILEDRLTALSMVGQYQGAYNSIQGIRDGYAKLNVPPPVRFFVRCADICSHLDLVAEQQRYLDSAKEAPEDEILYLMNHACLLWSQSHWVDTSDPTRASLLAGMKSDLDAFKRLARDVDTDATYFNNYAAYEYVAGHFKRSETQARKSIEISPEESLAHFNLGLALFRQDKYSEAESAFSTANAFAEREANTPLKESAKLFRDASRLKQSKIKDKREAGFLHFLFEFCDAIDSSQNFFVGRYQAYSQFHEIMLRASEDRVTNTLYCLKGWHSPYPPILPKKSDFGGGYYVMHRGSGIVIDPVSSPCRLTFLT